MLSLKRRDVTPPDLYWYKFPEDGQIISAYDHKSWLGKIKVHATNNGYPVPTQEQAEDQLCRRLSGEWCIGGSAHSFVNTRFKLSDFINGTKVLASFMLNGNVVSKEIAEQRALICSRCAFNLDIPGCRSCSGMADVIATAKGKGSTKYDHLLKQCGVCKCSNEVQAWVPAKDLVKGLEPGMLETFKEVDEAWGCWKYKTLDSMNDSVY